MTNRLPTPIESWFPFDTIGAVRLRDRGTSSDLPPQYLPHVHPDKLSHKYTNLSIFPSPSHRSPNPFSNEEYSTFCIIPGGSEALAAGFSRTKSTKSG